MESQEWVESLNSTDYGTMTGARARFFGWIEETRKCNRLGWPSSDRAALVGKTSIKTRTNTGRTSRMSTRKPGNRAIVADRHISLPRQASCASAISIRQWSLGPHSAAALRARTVSEPASSVEAKT